MHFTVTSRGNRHFEVFNEQNDSIGTIGLSTWRPNKGQITTAAGVTYNIAPTGFWQTTIAITKNDFPFAEIKAGWSPGLRLSFATESRTYVFKKKGFWNTDYAVYDEDGHEIAFVAVEYKWSTWSFNYEIDVHGSMADKETNMILPLLITYCARYTRMRQAAAS